MANEQTLTALTSIKKTEKIIDLRILFEKADLSDLEIEVKERVIQNFFEVCDIIEQYEKNL